MVKLAKKLKKNNVAVDFVAFGDGIEEGPLNVLKTFSDTASSTENSYVINLTSDPTSLSYIWSRHYIAVQPGPALLSDVLLSSAVLAADRGLPDELMGEAGPSGQGEGGGATQFEFGVDPSLDPELAMVCGHVGQWPTFFLYRTSLDLVGPTDIDGRGAGTSSGGCATNSGSSTRTIDTESYRTCARSGNCPCRSDGRRRGCNVEGGTGDV